MNSTSPPWGIARSRRSLLRAGFTDDGIYAMLERESIARVAWGLYQWGRSPERPEERHRQLIEAAVERFRPGSGVYISHASAAIVHGAPVFGVDLTRVAITRPGRAGASSSGAVRPHRAQLLDDEVTVVDGIPVTSAARTALDMARTYSFMSAVVTVDALLHEAVTTADEVAEVLRRAQRRGSAGRAAPALAFADGAAESAAESRSRVVMAEAGLPAPRVQARVLTEEGEFVARCDFGIEEFDTVAECDGVSKYVRFLRPGESVADAVIREKRREDAIRDTGRQMVRWTPAEINRAVLLGRFSRAFARAGFPGWSPGPPRAPRSGASWVA